jgi:hypothetical protein
MASDINKVIELKSPIEFGGTVIGKLSLRPAKAKDLRDISVMKFEELTFGQILDLAGRLAGQPREVMDQLSVEDVGQVMEVMMHFLGGSKGS